MSFDLPPGKYLLRLGIRDDRTCLTGSLNATVSVETQDVSKNTGPDN
jgi:hypothetical protein